MSTVDNRKILIFVPSVTSRNTTEWHSWCLMVPLLFLAYFLYFEKIKTGLSDHHAFCVSMYPPFF
jgi:hypothetical protein